MRRGEKTTKYADFISDWQLSLLRVVTETVTDRGGKGQTERRAKGMREKKATNSREISCGALH